MPSAGSDLQRNVILNDLFAAGQANAIDILTADFGHWPPKGLSPIDTPDIAIDFKTFFHVRKAYRALVLDATPTTIQINKRNLLSRVFNPVSADLGHTLSHENVHVLQHVIMHGKGLIPLRENYVDFLRPWIDKNSGSYNANIDEIQANLHAIVSDHYRRTQKMPLNVGELWALLRTERVMVKSAYVDDLLENSMEGRWAKKNFPEADARPRKKLLQDVANLTLLFLSIRPDKIDEFCEDIIPAAYGRLLEIYGDHYGCMRLGDNHNLLLSEIFIRQAQALETDLQNGLTPDTAAIEKTILTLPLSQAGCLERTLPRHGGWSHKRTGKTVPLTPETIDLVTGLLRRQTAPR